MSYHTSRLAAKVAAVNSANAEAKRIYPVLFNLFKGLDGQKVIKTGGVLTQKVVEMLPHLPKWCITGNKLNVYFNPSHYSIRFTIQADEYCEIAPGETRSARHEISLYICDLNGQFAKMPSADMSWIQALRTDWTCEEVAALRKQVEIATRAAREAEAACSAFGLYDQ